MTTKKGIKELKCRAPRCSGVMFDVTPALAAAMGVLHRRREKCGAKYAFTAVDGGAAAPPSTARGRPHDGR